MGCSNHSLQTSKPFDKVVIVNQTHHTLTHVSIDSKTNQRKMQCKKLIPQGFCEYKFHRKKNVKNHFQVQWRMHDKTYTYNDIAISNVKLQEGEPVSISINILNDGKFLMKQL